jgi:CubicO group peptidase (beta-lactamase class C family)
MSNYKHFLLTALMCIAALAIFIGCGDLPSGVDSTNENVVDIENKIRQAMQDNQIPGLAAAVICGDKIIWRKGFGYADLEKKIPATADTPFRVASVGKTVIAVALMQAIEQGKLSLNDDINSFGLPFIVDNPNISGESITIRHLATHTSGIIDGPAYDYAFHLADTATPLFPDADSPATVIVDMGKFLEAYLKAGGEYYSASDNYLAEDAAVPGTTYQYCNVASALSAYALQFAEKTDFDQYCEEHIFVPLGMTNTHWLRKQYPAASSIATGYEGNPRTAVPPYELTTYPDGGLHSSANDLARFLGAIMNGGQWQGTRILGASSIDTMLSSQTNAALPPDYGMTSQGIFWEQAQGIVWGHTGGDPGIAAAIYFEPSSKVGIVLVMNSRLGSENINALISLIMDLIDFGRKMSTSAND